MSPQMMATTSSLPTDPVAMSPQRCGYSEQHNRQKKTSRSGHRDQDRVTNTKVSLVSLATW